MTPERSRRLPAYGFDIETDTTTDGLDPASSRITAVGVAGRGWVQAFAGPEHRLLTDVDHFLARLPTGHLVSWNGAAFDFPFLHDRAATAGVPLGLRIEPDAHLLLTHQPLAGHRLAYRVRWWGHGHIDAYLELRPTAHRVGSSARLKAFAALNGIGCVEHDYERLADLTPDSLAAYVASDAVAALVLADRYGLTGSLLGGDAAPAPGPAPAVSPEPGPAAGAPPVPAGPPGRAGTAPGPRGRPAA